MIIVHFGEHEGTTGSHLAEAADRLGLGRAEPRPRGQHYQSLATIVDDYLWVESGVTSLPLDAHKACGVTMGYLIDVHLHIDLSVLQAALFDHVFVAQRTAVATIAEVHPSVEWLPLAAPSSFLTLPRQHRFPVAFVGNVVPGSPRDRLLSAVADRVAMNDWRRRYRVREMGDVYRQTIVVINPPARDDLNMRFFEAMACGALVLTSRAPNGQELLAEEGVHFVTENFDDVDAVAEAAASWSHRIDAEEIGRHGRELIAASHTYEHRMATIAGAIGRTERNAPVRAMSARARSSHYGYLACAYGDWALARASIESGPLLPLREPAIAASIVESCVRHTVKRTAKSFVDRTRQ